MSKSQLCIFFNDQRVGELNFNFSSDSIDLSYDPAWIKNGFPLSPNLPLSESEFSSGVIKRFLENLFPEGDALENLLESFRVGRNNTFRITQLIGRDATGALEFVDSEAKERESTSFREITSSEMEKRLDERSTHGLILWDGKLRLSIAGVQDKLPVTILSDGKIGLGEGNIASTHILKFQKNDPKVPHLVLNEYFCLKLAQKVGLEVPEVFYKKFGKHPALVVKRFDRVFINDKKIIRKHIIDSCQALDLRPTYKYEKNFGSGKDVAHIRDGVTFKKIFETCMKTQTPALAIQRVLRWMLFNLCISNSDAHGKNISFFVTNVGAQLSLCPWYDLVNIEIYPNLDHELALSIGDEFDPSQIYAYQLLAFCDECNIAPRLLKNELEKLLQKIRLNLSKIALPECALGEDEQEFWLGLVKHVEKKCQHFDAVIPDLLKLKI